MEERKFVQPVLVTWPRWLPCPYMVKTLNLKSLLLRNQTADDLETLYAASGAQVLPSLFKWWSWVDLDLFYGNVRFDPLCFGMGEKGKTMDFSETIVVYDLKLATNGWSDKKFLLTSKLCPWGCMPPAPGLYTTCIKLNHEKNCITSDFKEISLRLATNG